MLVADTGIGIATCASGSGNVEPLLLQMIHTKAIMPPMKAARRNEVPSKTSGACIDRFQPLSRTEEKEEYDGREVRQVSRDLDRTQKQERDREEYGDDEGIQSRHDAEDEYETEERFDRTG